MNLKDQTSTRIAILSDTHDYVDARVLELVSNCDAAIHAGDIGNADVLNSLKPKLGLVFAVAGNNDTESKWDPSEADTVNSLKSSYTIPLSGGTLSVEHGHTIRDTHRYHEVLRERYPGSRAVVYGHTHKRVIDQSESPWVLNPGAAGRVRTNGGPSCLILEIDQDDWAVSEHTFPD